MSERETKRGLYGQSHLVCRGSEHIFPRYTRVECECGVEWKCAVTEGLSDPTALPATAPGEAAEKILSVIVRDLTIPQPFALDELRTIIAEAVKGVEQAEYQRGFLAGVADYQAKFEIPQREGAQLAIASLRTRLEEVTAERNEARAAVEMAIADEIEIDDLPHWNGEEIDPHEYARLRLAQLRNNVRDLDWRDIGDWSALKGPSHE